MIMLRYKLSSKKNENKSNAQEKICGSCGGTKDLRSFEDKWVCKACVDEVQEIMSKWNADDVI